MWNRICEKKKLWIVLDSPPLNVAPPADLLVDFLVELHVDWSADLLVDLCVDPNVDLGVELAASPIEDLCHMLMSVSKHQSWLCQKVYASHLTLSVLSLD